MPWKPAEEEFAIGQDLVYQARGWKTERVAWVFMALLLVSALAALPGL